MRSEEEKKSKKKSSRASKKKVQTKISPKIDKEKFLKKLIKPTRGGANETSQANLKSVKLNDENQLVIGTQKYRLTPKGILWAALDAYYHIGSDMKKFHEFMKELNKHLSMLSSNNTDTDMFGDDFNDFFEVYVTTLNLCGEMKKALEENGVKFDITQVVEDIEKQTKELLDQMNDRDENTDDEEDTQEDGENKKPRKRK